MPAPRHGLSIGVRLFLHATRLFVLVCLAIATMATIGIVRGRGARQRHVRTNECKSNLRGAYTAERVYFEEHNAYTPDLTQVGYDPERSNRYAYFAASSGVMEDRSAATIPMLEHHQAVGVDRYRYPELHDLGFDRVVPPTGAPLGLRGTCPECQLTLVCVAEFPEDSKVDVWSVSTADRTSPRGEHLEAGLPFHETPADD